jgi:RimJ/RimL family protein N-acetyltransferase
MTFCDDEVFKKTARERRIPVLATQRLTLQPPCHHDVETIARIANDRRIAENTARIPHPYRLEDAEKFIAAVNRGDEGAVFVIMLGDALIGVCGIDACSDSPELGYWLGVPYWGCGLATEAARALVDYAFGELRYDMLTASARVSNPASRRVLEKCAFQWSSVRLTRIRAINSAAPVDRFRLDRKLWASLKDWSQLRRVV